MWSEEWFDLGEVRLHALTAGQGPLVVLLHGFPDFSLTWRHQIPALAEAGYRVVAPDMRGYNLSDKPEGTGPYELERLTGDVGRLIEACGEGSAHVAGHDWGAIVAWHLAMERPEVLRRLAILNVPHPGRFLDGARNLRQVMKSWYVAFFQLPWLPESAIGWDDFRFLRDTYRKIVPHEDVEAYIEAARRSRNLHYPINYYRAYVRRAVGHQRRLRRIDLPVLVVWGDRDLAIEPDMAEPPADLVPDATVVHLESATHWPHQGEPDTVNRLLLAHFGMGD